MGRRKSERPAWVMHLAHPGQGALCDQSTQVIYAVYAKDSTCDACKAIDTRDNPQ